jgi:hypothetical protein
MWLIVNLMIAFLVYYNGNGESISAGNFVTGVIISTLVGHLMIMLITKLLHILYMNNIENAFNEELVPVKLLKKREERINDTQKTEKALLVKNEYAMTNSEKFETKMSINKWEELSMASSQQPDTARNILKSNSRPNSASQNGMKVVPYSLKIEVIQRKEDNSYMGDLETMTSESKRGNNLTNTTVFLIMM